MNEQTFHKGQANKLEDSIRAAGVRATFVKQIRRNGGVTYQVLVKRQSTGKWEPVVSVEQALATV